MKKVAMIGVGKLGQDCAEVMATKYDVVGYDVEPRNPGFPMRNTIQEAVYDRDIIFIAAPTPHDPVYGGETPTSHLPNKDFDYTIVTEILKEVNKFANKQQLVVLISTVLPGTVRQQLEPCITNARFIYNPYLIAMGTVKWDMINPEMVIIGTEDGSLTGDAEELINFYKPLMENNPRYEVGTWDEAESIKIFYNTFISTKLALVNMIQDIAERNGNINVDVVTTALAKSTYRIMGPAYMKAGLGDAGACHPRDNIALRYLANRLNLGYDLFDSIMRAREVQAENMALKALELGKNITIVGKAYKPGVHYTNGSASMLIAYYVETHGGNVNYYDIHTNDLDLKADWTQVYLIGYWEDYVTKLQFPTNATVIDPWRLITKEQHQGNIVHYGNTRPKNKPELKSENIATTLPITDVVDEKIMPADSMRARIRFFYSMYPDLYKYRNSIHIIYAGLDPIYCFNHRPIESVIKEIKEQHANGKKKFLFYAPDEGVVPSLLERIHTIVWSLTDIIPSSNFIYVVGAIDGEEVYNKLADKNNWQNKITILACYYFEFSCQKGYANYEYTGEYQAFPKSHRNKVFLCFNKAHRQHRVDFLEKVLSYNLLADSYYSFEGDIDWKDKIETIDGNKYPFIKANKHLFPLRLNINSSRTNPIDIIPDDFVYFDNSYFSVVTETGFYSKSRDVSNDVYSFSLLEDCMFISEKIYKCFVLQHPFIVLARPHTLKTLRERGYKTFSPIIDESYDEIENDDDRLQAVFNEVLRLTRMDPYELQNFTTQVKSIVEYNKFHFFELKHFSASKNYLQEFSYLDADNEVFNVNVIEENLVNSLPVEPVIQEVIDNIGEEIQQPNEDTLETKPVTLFDTINFRPEDDEILTMRLPSGVFYKFSKFLANREEDNLEEIFSYASSLGKYKFSHCLNYYSGTGILGLELLGLELCNKVSFINYYDNAVSTIEDTIKNNHLQNFTKVYKSATVTYLPNHEKFDLIVGTPPSYYSKEQYLDNNTTLIPHLLNEFRKNVDIDYSIMIDFFKNIKSYITHDALILFIVDKNDENIMKIMSIAGKCGFSLYNNQVLNKTRQSLICFRLSQHDNLSNNNNENNNVVFHTQEALNSVDLPSLIPVYYDDDKIFMVPEIPVADDLMSCQLSNNSQISFYRDTNSDSHLIKDDIKQIINNSGFKQNYNKTLNWCSGTGAIGFELLCSNKTQELTFFDSFLPAIEQTIKNINVLNFVDRVKVLNLNLIQNIKPEEKYDLVVGFPPNSADFKGYVNFMLNQSDSLEKLNYIINYARMLVDQDFLILKEFFTNIAKNLVTNADVYIVANYENDEFKYWATRSKLEFLKSYELKNLSHLCVLHFRKND